MNTTLLKKVSFLATGDEIINGDILNTNTQKMAQALFDHGITIGFHVVVTDDQADIEKAIQFLLMQSDAIIITGGLGPTSDDRTRFALSAALAAPLVFDEASWQAIEDRFQRYALKNQPASNRHQAYFPQQAKIIPNENGTAAGCWLAHDNKLIFMLPGPPRECLPMFDSVVFPTLLQYEFQRPIIQKKWLLFGVSEGEIAAELDAIALPLGITTGYRMRTPYVETKIRSEDHEAVTQFCQQALPLLDKYLINADSIPASEKLIDSLHSFPHIISIEDRVTRGMLEKTLHTASTCKKIYFGPTRQTDFLHIELKGLDEVWEQQTNVIEMTLSIKFNQTLQTYRIPYRGERSVLYATELICMEIMKFLFPLQGS